MKLTIDLLQTAFPTAAKELLSKYIIPLQKTLDNYEFTTDQDIAMFLAQIGHESLNLRFIKENLNYSSRGLLSTFPKYFTPEQAEKYARSPEKIGSRVYANRMGNGSEASGDGYRYCGRGLIQLTGKDNYLAFAKATGRTLPDVVQYLETIEGACESAGYFWKKNNLNGLSVEKTTKIINGGTNGLEDRRKRFTDISRYILNM